MCFNLNQSAGNSNTNRDQDLFWAARGKKASMIDNWEDTAVLVDPFTASLLAKRDGSGKPFWAARGKKYAAEGSDGTPFWAARGKKGNFTGQVMTIHFS